MVVTPAVEVVAQGGLFVKLAAALLESGMLRKHRGNLDEQTNLCYYLNGGDKPPEWRHQGSQGVHRPHRLHQPRAVLKSAPAGKGGCSGISPLCRHLPRPCRR